MDNEFVNDIEEDNPNVMCFSGSDPTGGAGIQADIEALVSVGCHALPVITAITAQDTQDVKGYMPLDVDLITEQARAVLEDISVDAIKIGMLGSVEAAEAIHSILKDYGNLPVIFDPVLVSGGGTPLSDDELIEAIRALIVPLCTIITPNSLEARQLCIEADNLDACAHELMDMGANYVLIKGSHENTVKVINTIYGNNRVLERFEWERLPYTYHGSGCTLAASLAGLVAQGVDPISAAREAQQYTWETLKHATRKGMGQHIPERFFWAYAREQSEEQT
jgi:hydroxymethylpyrimidine/phosphomethylpyrimidine kinase